MRAPIVLSTLLVVTMLLAVVGPCVPPVLAEDAAEAKPHTNQQIKEHEVFVKFEEKFKSDDVDDQIQILRWFGMWRHKKVLRELRKIWLKDKDYELRAVAAEGLGRQSPYAKKSGKYLIDGLGKMTRMASREDPEGDELLEQTLEARAIVSGIKAVGALAYKDGWDTLKVYIDHYDDSVAIEMMLTCGRLKEYRALPILLEWFNFYPDGYSYAGGSVKVDTGAAGTADAKAAKAKWKAKYGGRKKKARPAAWEALIQSLEMITGEKFEKPVELKDWMKKNKVLLRKHGV